MIIWWSQEDQAFLVDVAELPGCMAQGNTRVGAIQHAEEAIALWIRTAKDDGLTMLGKSSFYCDHEARVTSPKEAVKVLQGRRRTKSPVRWLTTRSTPSLPTPQGQGTLGVKMRTVEAVIEPNGEVRLVEPVRLAAPSRALVTILEEAPLVHEAALLSEAALAEDWNRAEEDAAWAHLQPGKSS